MNSGVNSGLYKILLVLHLLSVVVGFGTVFLNGVYGAQSKRRQGPPGLAVAEANLTVSDIAEKVIYTVPLWGVLLVLVSDDVWEFTDTWVWLSFLLYAVGIGISHGVLLPNVKRMIGLMQELATGGPPPAGAAGPPPQVAELEQRGKTVGAAGGALNVLVIIILALMVFKPGV